MRNDLLRRVPLFATLTDAEFRNLERIFRIRSYRKNQVIFLEEEAGTYMYIVLAGKVKVTVVTPEQARKVSWQFTGRVISLERCRFWTAGLPRPLSLQWRTAGSPLSMPRTSTGS